MAVKMQALLFLLQLSVWASFADATGYKVPPPADNGCYTGRSDGSINVQAVFDMGGVTGYVQFYQRAPGEPTEINVNLEGLDQFAGSYPWHAHQFPVRDALQKDFPCSLEEIGRHYDPLNVGGSPTYDADCNPGNQSACEVGDFGGKVGRIRNDMVQQFYLDNELDLYEQNSVIGRALVIHYPEPRNDRFICANIEPVGCRVKNLRAAFDNGEFQGDVVIRHTAGKDNAKIFVDVYSTDTAGNGTRSWNLFMGRAGADGSCDGLAGDIFGTSGGFEFPGCSNEKHRLCRIGDLTSKCGPLQFVNGRARLCCTDTQLGTVPFSTLYDPANGYYLSVRIQGGQDVCAPLEKVRPQVAKATIVSSLMFGKFIFFQNSPLDRTFVRPYLLGIRQRNIQLQIRMNAVADVNNCSEAALGAIHSKPGTPVFGRPLGSRKTGDSVLIGNLAPKVPIPLGSQSIFQPASSHYLPVFGPHSIVGRSLVVVEVTESGPVYLACGTIRRLSDYPDDVLASITGYQDDDTKV